MQVTRRAVMMGAGAITAWLTSPARALMQMAGRLDTPSFIDPLVARMTLEEKAGQLTLMAAAWGAGQGGPAQPARKRFQLRTAGR